MSKRCFTSHPRDSFGSNPKLLTGIDLEKYSFTIVGQIKHNMIYFFLRLLLVFCDRYFCRFARSDKSAYNYHLTL